MNFLEGDVLQCKCNKIYDYIDKDIICDKCHTKITPGIVYQHNKKATEQLFYDKQDIMKLNKYKEVMKPYDLIKSHKKHEIKQ